MARVVFDHVWKRYGNNAVVEDLTLEVPDGEFVVLVGPSGSGKSTALRMLAGLEEISQGNVIIGDRVVTGLTPKDRDIAMVFQSYALYPHMSIYDNLAYGLKLHHVAKPDIDRRVREAASFLGIAELLDRKPRQLSGGQRQRVALGRAIVREPQVFLMDEPLSNLDAKLRVQTRAEIIKLHQRLGTTTIYVTHDQVEAMTMGDRIAVLNQGRLQQFDTPDRLYHHPVNSFVAGFIGSPAMNFFQMRVQDVEGQLKLVGEHFSLPVSAEDASALAAHRDEEVTVGIRPEDIVDRRLDGRLPADAVIPVKVDVVETLGPEQYVYLETAAGDTMVARMPPDIPLRAGNTVDVVLPPDRLYFFDLTSGDAIRGEEVESLAEAG
ncbi:MAG TPA: sn-glycerol-3-phosphate ABC transporter ATP-binding protein UgpC [Thermomicrobiaceae bacterium]|nr:sn-glycerol-3-phosphate ABC transporter ATP-binding protein UgpC [Thermomicrobiaceae bacterium]